jgi:diguanylate cyclase (GGDEF)-like protein
MLGLSDSERPWDDELAGKITRIHYLRSSEFMPNKPELLIVDDSAVNRSILRQRLSCAFQITEADRGLRALELLCQRRFDLVLLDIIMPDLSGMEVVRRLRQHHSAISLPVIMVTAKTEGIDIAEALTAGANDYITKPVDLVVAAARINTQIELKRAREQIQHANTLLEQRVARRTCELVRANEQLKREMAERERSQAEVYYLAHYDPLTGLANRVLLLQRVREDLARIRRSKEAIAVLFVELDGFKTVHDTLGLSIGDKLLKNIASRLKENVREIDKVARTGGDEFAIIQAFEQQPASAAGLARRLIEVISRPCVIDGHELVVGASIGIAVESSGEADPEHLIKNASLAMCRAKADGRGSFRFFEPEMDARAQARCSMEAALRNALSEKEFELYYQPLIDLEANRLIGLEALIRWQHPERGTILPSEFIPLAEEIGLMVPLGEWVMQQACADAANWPEDIYVAVNLSPMQFKCGKLLTTVSTALDASGLAPHRLELEITESVILEKTEHNVAVLNALRCLGVRIAMDDFGTGYSSLSYLRSFPFDKIKIDQSFVHDLSNESDTRAIVRAIVELGHSLGIAITAEGIETDEQLQCLKQEGCMQAQGYLFSPPRPAKEVCSLIARLATPKACSPSATLRHERTVMAAFC